MAVQAKITFGCWGGVHAEGVSSRRWHRLRPMQLRDVMGLYLDP